MDWARILAYVTGTVDQELLARNEYLAAENRILKAQLKGRLKLSDAERATLGEIGHRLGRKVLGEVANVARPDTILAWYRKLVARKFDGSKARRSPGRPRIKGDVEQLIVRMARENRDWGYDRIAGALTFPYRAGSTKGRAMLLFLGVRRSAATGLFNAGSDWVACCVITIRRQRSDVPANGAPKQKAENNADKGRAAGATYAAAYTGAGRVAASI